MVPITCEKDEVPVLAHCRKVKVSAASKKSVEKMKAFVETKQVVTDGEENKKATKAVLQAMVAMIKETPSFIAQVVHGMRKLEKSVADVHERYAKVVAEIDASESLKKSDSIKRSVFSILLEFR